jgi:hypothetical protein
MIIKSMSRATASFEQIIDYVERHKQDSKHRLYYNIFSREKEAIKEEFEKNSKHVKTRKNGVYMYHEVLSLEESYKLSREKQKELLREVALEYIKSRAEKNIAYGILHDEKDRHLHYHLVFSSNEFGKSKKTRLSKKEFNEVKQGLEKWVLEKYPELGQKKTMQTKRTENKLSSKGGEMKRRTKQSPPQRERVKNELKNIFRSSRDKQEFFNKLEKSKLEIYVRGKAIGFKDLETGRNHRVNTLGLSDDFRAISDRIGLETVKAKTHKQKQDKKQKEQQEEQYKKAQGQKEEVKRPGKGQEKRSEQKKRPDVSRSTETKKRTREEIKAELARADREELKQRREQQEKQRKQKSKTKAKKQK